jgi:hypothetical protein
MVELNADWSCQICQVTFLTKELLDTHLQRFAAWASHIRIWDEQCRAHLEPRIEYDPGPDDLDTAVCRDHPALLNARRCPVTSCGKTFGEKKQLNIHFETHCQSTESCIVCRVGFSHVAKLLSHTLHPEAIPRHRSYIRTCREEERKRARDKLHSMLIEASNSQSALAKRGRTEAGHDDDDQSFKRFKPSEENGDDLLTANRLEAHGIWNTPSVTSLH